MMHKLRRAISIPLTVFLCSVMLAGAQEPPQTTTTLRFDWAAGYAVESVDPGTTVVRNEIVLEIRDKEGNIVGIQRQSVHDCTDIHGEPGLEAGVCGSEQTFITTLAHRQPLQKWARGEWVLSNGAVVTYTVPFSPSTQTDDRGFSLIETLEWHDTCPQNPPTPTAQPTYTVQPEPTCRPTFTPEPTPTPYPTHTPWPTQPPLQ